MSTRRTTACDMCKPTRSLFACSVHIKVKGLRPRSTGFDQVYQVINSPVTPLPQARKRLGRWKLIPCMRHKLQRVWVSVTRSIYYPCQFWLITRNAASVVMTLVVRQDITPPPPPTHIRPPPPQKKKKKKKRKKKKTARPNKKP